MVSFRGLLRGLFFFFISYSRTLYHTVPLKGTFVTLASITSLLLFVSLKKKLYASQGFFCGKRSNCPEPSYVRVADYNYSRREYKFSVPLKKTRCPTAYQRLKKRNRFNGVYTLTIFTRHFPSNSAQNPSIEEQK